MFTDKTVGLNVTSSHPGAWLDLGRVINVLESEGASPLGHRLWGPGAVRVIQRSPLGMGGELGKCAGQGQAGLLTLPQEVPQGRRGGRGPVPGSEPPNHGPGLLRAPRLLSYDPRGSSINACFFLLLSRPFSGKIRQNVSFVLKFTEIIRKFLRWRNAYSPF